LTVYVTYFATAVEHDSCCLSRVLWWSISWNW